jgi:hypothetical protein
MGHSPATLRAAAVVQAAEAALVLAATVLAGIDTAAGRSYQTGSGIALTVIGAASAAGLAAAAAGLARARRWSRTPALLTQVFVGIVGIYLLQANRLDWGVLSVVLAFAGLAALLAPPSLRALAGGEKAQPGPSQPKEPGQPKQPPADSKRPPDGSKQPAAGPGQPARSKQPGQPRPTGQARSNRRRSARPGAE